MPRGVALAAASPSVSGRASWEDMQNQSEEGTGVDTGERRLRQLGYKQELRRDLSFLSNFAFSFNIACALQGVSTLFNVGLNYGGPVVITWGWVVVSFFSLLVGLSLAEITSAYPTSGGLYFWSSHLGGPEWGPFAAWMTGWGGGYYPGKGEIIGIYAAILVVHGALISAPVRFVAWIMFVAIWWYLLGGLFLVAVLPSVALTTQPASFVFTGFVNNPDVGISSTPYLLLVGLLFAQYTLVGFDASAHMSEETKSADWRGAWAMVVSIVAASVVGFLFSISLLLCTRDPALATDPANEAGGYASAQVMWDVFFERYGSGTGGIILMQVVTIASFFCGMAALASCSRMNFAFARDGAMPGSFLWCRSNPATGAPVYAVWLSVVVCFCMGLPYLGSAVVFTATVSIGLIGLYIAYGIPIFLRHTLGRREFVPGPFHLGRFSLACGALSCLWVCLLCVLFCLPTIYPVSFGNFQYSSATFGMVLLLTLGGWFFNAKRWFKGPIRTVDENDPIYNAAVSSMKSATSVHTNSIYSDSSEGR
eukprot:jgi/Mesen1/8573/ME000497S07976